MLTVEDVLSELSGEGDKGEKGLPPGFRFHPTDEELLTFYLASKVFVHGRAAATATTGILQYPDTWHSYPHPAAPGCIVIMAEVDLNRCEPWELPEAARMGEREWYFFSLRDRKYPSGLRTNRATGAGYWKATGKDRKVHSGAELIGMKKTLVFYKGRAPRGVKTRWVMHEYRLDGHFYPHYLPPSPKEEWVICRIFHKLEQNSLLSSRDRPPVSSPLPANSLPPLLEETTPTPPLPSLSRNDNSNFLINNQTWELPHHQLDQKSLFDPLNFSSLPNPFVPMNATHPAFPSTTTSAPSMTFMRSLLPSHQQQLPKQCKIETNLSHFQLSPDPTWLHMITHHDNPSPQRAHHFPLNFGSDCGLYALTGGTAAVAPQTEVDMSTSLAFDRLLGSDCSIKVAGESWPLDP